MLAFLRNLLGLVPDEPIVMEPGPVSTFDAQRIQACRERLGSAPRTFSSADRTYFDLRLQPDLEEHFRAVSDPMLRILTDQDALRDRGQVVWGRLVQANQILFDPRNSMTAPANVVYSLDPDFDSRTEFLGRIGGELFAQKGTVSRDRELREFVRVVTNELERIMRRELPRPYCGGRSVYFATCFIQPNHLPGNCIARPEFPLLVNFEETEGVMILPSKYWSRDLVSEWMA